MATQTRLPASAGVASRYRDVRALSRALAAPLSDADATIQPMPDASPAKWHLAHTTWFFETFILRDHVAGYRPFDERWAFLFNSYYEVSRRICASEKHRLQSRRPSPDEFCLDRAPKCTHGPIWDR